MRFTSGELASSAMEACPRRRLRERALEVRMCRANACRRLIFPVPVFLNRLDAPLWVFNFGIRNDPRWAAVGDGLNKSTTGAARDPLRCSSCRALVRAIARRAAIRAEPAWGSAQWERKGGAFFALVAFERRDGGPA